MHGLAIYTLAPEQFHSSSSAGLLLLTRKTATKGVNTTRTPGPPRPASSPISPARKGAPLSLVKRDVFGLGRQRALQNASAKWVTLSQGKGTRSFASKEGFGLSGQHRNLSIRSGHLDHQIEGVGQQTAIRAPWKVRGRSKTITHSSRITIKHV